MAQPIGTSGITPASKPAPLPKGPGFLGNLGKSVGNVAQGAGTATRTAGRAVTYKPPRSGGSDAATSGSGYGSVQANAYKTTPAYHKAISDVFLHQPAAQQGAILTHIMSVPKTQWTPEIKGIRSAWQSMGVDQKTSLLRYLPHSPGIPTSKIVDEFLHVASGIGQHIPGIDAGAALDRSSALRHGADAALGGVDTAINALSNLKLGPQYRTTFGNAAQAGPGPVPAELLKVPVDVTRAAVQDPSVVPKTIKGLADSTVGMVAGGVQLPIRMIQQGPGKALSGLAGQMAADYSRRYGPLLSGNDKAFIDRIKKEGAAPEAFDTMMALGGLDATAGRAVSDVARAREAVVGKPGLLTRSRPDLLISGNKVRPQALASTAGRATAQRLEDWMRTLRQGELKAREGQVAPIFQSHAIRVVHSGIAQGWRRVMQENLAREVRGKPSSALAAIGKLNQWQRQAIYHAVQGIRVDTPANLREDLAARYRAIEADRQNAASLGNRIPAQHADKVDELKLIDRLMGHADKIAGPKMVAFQKAEAARAIRIEGATALHPATAEARRLRPVGDRLGIEHPDVTAAKAAKAAETTKATEAASNATAPRASVTEGKQPSAHAYAPSADAGALGAASQFKAFAPYRRGVLGGIGVIPRHPSFGASLDAARAARTAEKTAALPRTERLAAYVKQVRAGMAAKGLPEPGYFRHQERPDVKYGDFTSGSGARAMPADKTSTWALHRAGIADTSPQAYIQGLARSIKRPLQHRLVDDQFRAAALPTPTATEIQTALGHAKPARDLTGNELRRVLEHRGLDMNKVMFYNPGRLAERTLSDHGLLPKSHVIGEGHDVGSQELHDLLNQQDIVQPGKGATSDRFLTTSGYKAVPKTAFDEIQGGLKGSSLGGRLVGKTQGLSAGLILGQNPHFLIMNTLAHAIPAIAGTKGTILPDLLKAPFWWHGLTDAEKDRVRMFEGGRGGHYNITARLGSQAPNQIAAFGRRLEENGLVQKAKTLNPLHAILKAEDLQSNFFRHAVMYHEIKRQAFTDMAHEYSRAVSTWEQVKHIFDLGPQDRMKAIAQDMPKLEELGRTTVNILGDYGRFTARERQFFNNRAVLFYSFLRHVTRTLLYVLPARHPLALGMAGELGNLHVEEVKKLLGGQDLPWAYGRMFFQKGGKLSSVDLTSTSPLSSPLVDILSGGIKEMPRLITPALAPLLDIAYGQTPTGAPVKQNAFSFLNDILSLSYPYRQTAAARFGLRQQQSDSIPFLHERPQQFKTAGAQQYQAAKRAARGPLSQYLLGSLLGVYPKPDDSRVIAQHMAARQPGGGGGATSLLNSVGSGVFGVDLNQSLGDGVSGADLAASLR